ncbi:MAG TPA: hypothetical protein VK439_00570 [Rubrivivax sp.]|nr:hypothetical protein [Rubrivivax sp.]
MGTVIPLYPVRRAVESLQAIGRTDLRRLIAKAVVSELQNGRDGLSVHRQLQAHRLQQKPQGGGT